ncbi:hypothetical protein GN316_12965 [Xylophilus sp. Kf1]|nr:hypothetical protein [Xylophilus sp. Kf1]
MSQWTIQIQPTADGRFQWSHVPVDGEGQAHVGPDLYDTVEEARQAGEEALARHHETPLHGSDAAYAKPETPQYDEDTRLGESQSALQEQEDPRLRGDAPVSVSQLPIEAQVRAADEEGGGIARH